MKSASRQKSHPSKCKKTTVLIIIIILLDVHRSHEFPREGYKVSASENFLSLMIILLFCIIQLAVFENSCI